MASGITPNGASDQELVRRVLLRRGGAGLLIVGVVLLVIACSSAVQKYRRVRDWTPVDALVLRFDLVNEPHGRVQTDYRAHFTFQYPVAGRTLVNSTESDYTTSLGSEIRNWRMRFIPGSHVLIRYNPAQPAEITTDNLDARSFRQPLWVGGWAVLVLLIGAILRKY